jgi:hypothetical protein
MGGSNIVDVGRTDRGIDRAVCIGIVDHMHLGAADPG